jgi:N-acetylneuraminate synthase
MGFSLDQWKEIKAHCDEKNLEFMSSPFSNFAVDWLEDVGVKQYKIGSGEVSNLLLLERIAKTKKPVILSSGLSDWDELDKAVNFLKAKNIEVFVLQCTTSYPCPPEKWGLNMIQELKDKFNLTTGYSDHSGTPAACIAAASMGAEILEFHVVFDKRMFGPDASSSLCIDEVKYMAHAVRQIETAKNNPMQKEITTAHKELKVIFGKSLAVNKNLRKGDIIKVEDLEGKKPGDKGIPAKDFESVVGKKLKKDKNQWEFLNKEDFEE